MIFFSAAPLCIHSLFVFYFLGVFEFVYDINDTRMAVLVNDNTLFEQITVMTGGTVGQMIDVALVFTLMSFSLAMSINLSGLDATITIIIKISTCFAIA